MEMRGERMGLITCEKYKKIYDYEKYNGICPKCARYNRNTTAAQEHQEYHNKYDGGYSHTAQDNHHSYHQKYDTNQNPHGHQLKGVQETMNEILGAEHRVNLEGKASKKGNMNKKPQIILGVIFGLVLLSFLMPFMGIFIYAVAICVIIAVMKKKR